WRTPHFAYFGVVARWAVSACVASLMLRAALPRLARSGRRWISEDGLASWLLALELGVVLLVVPAFLLVKSVPEEDMTGWAWPLINKRWLLALYNLAIATFLVFPLAIDRWRARAEAAE